MPERVPDVYGGNMPRGIVWFKDRFVAVGGVNGGCCDGGYSETTQAVVWRSVDGRSWNLVPDSPAFALGGMHAVAASATLAVAVGARYVPSTQYPGEARPVGAAWTSTDGRSWNLVRDLPLFSQVAASEAGFVAVEEAGDRAAPAIWTSPDGRTWSPIAGREELGIGVIKRLVRIPNGFLAVGASLNVAAVAGAEEQPRAAVWRSPDGKTWSRVADQPAFENGTMDDVAMRDGRAVAVGHDADYERPVIWTSEDGVQWRRVAIPELEQDRAQIVRILALPAGYLATGAAIGEFPDWSTTAWSSTDGSSWAAIRREPGHAGEVWAWMGVDDGGALAVGIRGGSDGIVPASWIIR